MKPTLYTLLAAAAACGMASAAETAYTTPVGYETLPVTQSAFNYLGLRLHEATVAAGTMETVGTTSVQDSGADFSGISANPSSIYILEILDGSGIISEFSGSDVSGDVINTIDDLAGLGVSNGAQYSIRPAATLASVFGAANSAGLAMGFFGPTNADVIYSPNGSGGFESYYYDSGFASWMNASTVTTVDGALVALNYEEGLIISATGTAPSSIVVTGEVKKTGTRLGLLASAFNYKSSISPVGATLATAFNPADFSQGFFGPTNADVIYVPNGTAFDSYYYDSGFTSWMNASTVTTVDASTVDLPSGIIISNFGAATSILNSTPSSYSSL